VEQRPQCSRGEPGEELEKAVLDATQEMLSRPFKASTV
jgi:hypothetical protein